MASFNASGFGRPESREARQTREMAAEARERARIAALDDGAKVRLLARALAEAACRGAVSITDGIRAGLSDGDVQRLYGQAFERARRSDPAVFHCDLEQTP